MVKEKKQQTDDDMLKIVDHLVEHQEEIPVVLKALEQGMFAAQKSTDNEFESFVTNIGKIPKDVVKKALVGVWPTLTDDKVRATEKKDKLVLYKMLCWATGADTKERLPDRSKASFMKVATQRSMKYHNPLTKILTEDGGSNFEKEGWFKLLPPNVKRRR